MNQLIQLVAGLPRTGTNACNNTLLKTGEREKEVIYMHSAGKQISNMFV